VGERCKAEQSKPAGLRRGDYPSLLLSIEQEGSPRSADISMLCGGEGRFSACVFFALYLTNIEAHILSVWCVFCVCSLVVVVLITLLAFAQLVFDEDPATQGRS
jgi:hypothetical protein